MNQSIPKALLRAMVVSYVLSGILVLALSFALYKLRLKEAQINMGILLVQCAACLAGGFTAGKGIRNRRFFWGLAAGILYFAILFAVSFLIGQGELPDLDRSAAVLGCCAAGGVIGGILS